jgi:aryl-alcohol dehydrogenase-like predicted oxidoreductase
MKCFSGGLAMKKIHIEGLDKACSQIVMGSMIFTPDNMDLTSDILDTFVQEGGTTIDTAHVYNQGESEKAIGLWLKQRGNRDQMVIIDKGAHPDAKGPRVTPEAISQDLMESLQRLQVDYIDIYMLHRDDPNIPVEVIMNALNQHKEAGLIKVLGVSNWTHERIEEANNYAQAHGLAGFAVNSPNLSLAKPNEPRWPGCVSVDEESLRWHEKNQFPLFSWSSQAGGFFTGRFSPHSTDDQEMVRVYYNEENWQRYERTEQLAKRRGVTANQIALAYVLHQSFPTCAIIGPQNSAEFYSSLEAFNITLSAEEVDWLDLRT